jgi:hypothetical protein
MLLWINKTKSIKKGTLQINQVNVFSTSNEKDRTNERK